MRLQRGDPLPIFRAQTWDGKELTSQALAGKRVWMAFYRFATCPFCNLRMHEVRNLAAELQQAGLTVIGVLPGKPESVRDAAQRHGMEYPLVCDPDSALYAAFGIGTSLVGTLHPATMLSAVRSVAAGTFLPVLTAVPDGSMLRVPADFLIEPNLTIHTAHYGKAVSEHIPLRTVQAFAAGA